MSKRNPKSDVPRRIYRTTIKRIDKHLKDGSVPAKYSQKKAIKGNFNEFLIEILDWYEKSERNGHGE